MTTGQSPFSLTATEFNRDFTCHSLRGTSRTEAEHHQPQFGLLIAMHQGALNASHAGSAPQSKSKRAAFSQELPSALVSPCEATQSGAQ